MPTIQISDIPQFDTGANSIAILDLNEEEIKLVTGGSSSAMDLAEGNKDGANKEFKLGKITNVTYDVGYVVGYFSNLW